MRASFVACVPPCRTAETGDTAAPETGKRALPPTKGADWTSDRHCPSHYPDHRPHRLRLLELRTDSARLDRKAGLAFEPTLALLPLIPSSLVGGKPGRPSTMPEITDFAIIVLVVAGGLALAVGKAHRARSAPGSGALPCRRRRRSGRAAVHLDHVPVKTVERIAVSRSSSSSSTAASTSAGGGSAPRLPRSCRSASSATFATAALIAVFAHYALGFGWTVAGSSEPHWPHRSRLCSSRPAGISGRSGTVLEGRRSTPGRGRAHARDDRARDPRRRVDPRRGPGVRGPNDCRGGFGLVAARLLVPPEATAVGERRLYPVFALLAASRSTARPRSRTDPGSSQSSSQASRSATRVFPTSARSSASRALREPGRARGLVALGLTIGISSLGWETWLDGALLALILALVVRPIVTALALWPAD